MHPERHILPNRIVQHEDHLGDIADIFQESPVIGLHVHAVRADASALNLQQPQQHIHNGALPRAGSPHDSHGRPHLYGQIRMVENQFLRIGVGICDVSKLNTALQRKLLLLPGRKGHVHFIVFNLILKIIADTHEKRFEKGNGIDLVVDPVHGRQKYESRRRKGGKHLQHILRGDARNRKHDHISHHHGNAHGLDEKLGHIVVEAVALHRVYITPAAFLVLVHEILFLADDLDFLDTLDGLGDPFEETAVVILIVLPRFVHNGLEHLFDDGHQKHQRKCQQHGHDPVGHQTVAHHEQRHHTVGQQLQQGQDQRVHIVHVRGNTPLHYSRVCV